MDMQGLDLDRDSCLPVAMFKMQARISHYTRDQNDSNETKPPCHALLPNPRECPYEPKQNDSILFYLQ